MQKAELFILSGTSPNAPGNNILALLTNNFSFFDSFILDATIRGGTMGTTDVYLQRLVPVSGVWVDWIHFPQAAAGATHHYTVPIIQGGPPGITETGDLFLPVNTAIGCLLTPQGVFVRSRSVSGAGTTAGAFQEIILTGVFNSN